MTRSEEKTPAAAHQRIRIAPRPATMEATRRCGESSMDLLGADEVLVVEKKLRQAVAYSVEGGIPQHFPASRTRQGHFDCIDGTPGWRTHHHHAVRKEHGFYDR